MSAVKIKTVFSSLSAETTSVKCPLEKKAITAPSTHNALKVLYAKILSAVSHLEDWEMSAFWQQIVKRDLNAALTPAKNLLAKRVMLAASSIFVH